MVTLLHVHEVEDDRVDREVTSVSGDRGRWFELQGADAERVVRALLDAGFVERDGPRATRCLP